MTTNLALLERGLGSENLEGIVNFTEHQNHVIRVVSVAASALSLVSVLPAFYWFLRMKRSFRHHLIILLIASDVVRVSWYLIHPTIALARSSGVRSDSTFCQISGFLLAFGTEASDFAVLAIAIHVALFIFRPPIGFGRGGLYSYRYAVYALWVLLPLLSASLAFVNPQDAYVATSTFCYLPVRPFWYRLALAWIPRYFVFVTICLVYISVFIYVRIKFDRFGALRGSALDLDASLIDGVIDAPINHAHQEGVTTTSPLPHLVKHGLVPEQDFAQLPKLERHGLIPGSSDAQSSREPESPRRTFIHMSSGRMESLRRSPTYNLEPTTPRKPSPVRSSGVGETSRKPSLAPSSPGPSSPRKPSAAVSSLTNDSLRKHSLALSILEPDAHRKYSTGMTSLEVGSIQRLPSLSSPVTSKVLEDHRLSSTKSTSDSNVITRPRTASCPNPPPRGSSLAVFRSVSYHAGDIPRRAPPAAIFPLEQNYTNVTLGDPLAATRTAIRRQLRFLLIYPLVYLLLWTVPLINHLLGYSDYFVRHPSFPLTFLSIMLLSFRGGVDAVIFCWREKPWRNVKHSSGNRQPRLRDLRHFRNWRSWWSGRVVWLRRMSDPAGTRRVSDANAVAEMEMRQARQLWWWEEEGKKRRDSVWLGTDSMPADSESQKKKKKRGRLSEIQFDGPEEDGAGDGDGGAVDEGKMEAVRQWRDSQIDIGKDSAV